MAVTLKELVAVTGAIITEIDPTKRYLVICNQYVVTTAVALELREVLNGHVVFVAGPPKDAVSVLQIEHEDKKESL